ncbi:MAG TPA: hypothetical protein PLZ58_02185 [Candidatus Saccharibacteria bacterium]|nr:hypothetical protein [Candidatus Saccharibacteria bacterium]HRQ06585.1 hypothetical protein [Candidatus Saccharibacteria bacterium]
MNDSTTREHHEAAQRAKKIMSEQPRAEESKAKESSHSKSTRFLMKLGGGAMVAATVLTGMALGSKIGNAIEHSDDVQQQKIQDLINQSDQIDHQIAVENGEFDNVQLPMESAYDDPANTELPAVKQGSPENTIPSPIQGNPEPTLPSIKTR